MKVELEASSHTVVTLGAWIVKSEGQSVKQPVPSTSFYGDSTDQGLPVVELTSNSIPDQGNLTLVIEGEEVARKTSIGLGHSSKGKEVVAKGSSHQDEGEGNEGALASPRDRGSAVKATQT